VTVQKDAPSHVAIIGCGFTGTTAFYQLVHNYPVQRITIFESSGIFGPGFPYQADESPEYLLNNTNDTMCLDPSNRRAFVEWLHRHPVHSIGLDEKASKPRAVYGEFLQDVIAQTVAEADKRGLGVAFVPQEVVDLDQEAGGGITIHTENGKFVADAVILATGRCPDYDVYNLSDAPPDRYFPVHMPGTRLDVLPLDAECYVIGASLSAYDVVNQLYAASTGCEFVPEGQNRLRYVPNDNKRKVVLCSRSGRLKKVQSRHPYPVKPKHFSLAPVQKLEPGRVTLAQLFELMVKDAQEHGVDVDRQQMVDPYAGCDTAEKVNQQALTQLELDVDAAASDESSTANFIVDYLDAAQFEIWDVFASHALSPQQEALYRSKYETAMLSYAAPCPSVTAQKVLALMQSGNLRIISGVKSVTMSQDRKSFEIEHRFGKEWAPYLVNASGVVDRNIRSERQSALISNLTTKGMLSEYRRLAEAQNGINVDLDSFQSADTPNVYVANMFLWGPGFFVSSAIMMATVVNRILDAVFGGSRR
jgi:hypothetical protein